MDAHAGSGGTAESAREVLAGQPRTEVLDVRPGEPVSAGSGRPVYSRLADACASEYPRLVRLLTVYCGNRDIAVDLAQETLARGCAHWSRVRRMDDQRAWFTRVALNLARSRWRRLVVERRLMAVIAARPGLREPDPSDLGEALAVRSAVAELTPRQRAAVVLRYFDDLDLATTASVMHCSPGTVKKLTARGIASLRGRLQFEVTGEG